MKRFPFSYSVKFCYSKSARIITGTGVFDIITTLGKDDVIIRIDTVLG